MNFMNHSNLNGEHAFLSASQHSWLRYTDEKLISRYRNQQAAMMGTRLHEFASDCINLNQKLARTKRTLNAFVNDAIGFRMSSEVVLYYSENCFGTADAICFNEKDKLLRIHDLKTGVIPASMDQLVVYAALFCLEYGKNPYDIKYELRIYQNDEIVVFVPEPDDVKNVMELIKHFDSLLKEEKMRTL